MPSRRSALTGDIVLRTRGGASLPWCWHSYPVLASGGGKEGIEGIEEIKGIAVLFIEVRSLAVARGLFSASALSPTDLWLAEARPSLPGATVPEDAQPRVHRSVDTFWVGR